MVGRDEASTNLAQSLVQLRELRGWTQQQLGELAGIPRPTVANLESGSANPTLGVLVRIAAALSVTLDELVSPARASIQLYRKDELPVRRRGSVEVRQLLPDAIPGVTVERLALPPGARLMGVPHKPGTREYLTCETGQVRLTASGESHDLDEGSVVVFRGDQRHSYHNPGEGPSVAYSVVLP